MKHLPLSVFFSFSGHEKEKKKSPLCFLSRPATDSFAKPAEPASPSALLRQRPFCNAQALLRVPRRENKAECAIKSFYSQPLVFAMMPLPLPVFFSFSDHEKEKKEKKKSPLCFLSRPATDSFATPAELASPSALLRQRPFFNAQALLRVPRRENKAEKEAVGERSYPKHVFSDWEENGQYRWHYEFASATKNDISVIKTVQPEAEVAVFNFTALQNQGSLALKTASCPTSESEEFLQFSQRFLDF